MSLRTKIHVALLSGGISSERDVSLKSGQQVYDALDQTKYDITCYDPKTDLPLILRDAGQIDIALIILHGPYGEDGTIQGFLDLIGIPYQGSGVLGSALSMNKMASKNAYLQAGLCCPRSIMLEKAQPYSVDECVVELGLPIVVKPVEGGSSIGMSIPRTSLELKTAIDTAFEYDHEILLETYIQGTELTCGAIGNSTRLETLPIIEIVPNKKYQFFDYEAKYTTGATDEICPARISEKIAEKVRDYTIRAHKALFLKGYSRSDFILKNEDIYILETNTIPGMTANSLLPLSARTAGISFSALLDKLIELGIEEASLKKSN
ncbi:MAG: D-alanine--D-alanine ligase [Proteobacteria bacterium]|nr:D-alanine--D-alanine ligase [Pseudomonadota bacterium]